MSDGAKKFEEKAQVNSHMGHMSITQIIKPKDDPVDNPSHYTSHPSGIECIDITCHMSFNLGNALKYIWRADLKNDAVEDLKKAKWYIEKELEMRDE